MGKRRLICFLCCIAILTCVGAQAQDTSAVQHKDSVNLEGNDFLDKKTMDSISRELNTLFKAQKSSFIRAEIYYLDNNVYMGRKDTVLTPYLTASLGYFHRSGLSVNVSASYLPSSGQSRIDLVTIDLGYSFNIGKFQGQLGANKFFYSNESNVVDADLKGSFSLTGAYDFGFIKPVISPTLNLSNKMDFSLTAGIEHTFFGFNHALDITPAFTAGGSTQNYYNSYYKDRKFRIKITNRVVIVRAASISGEVLNAAQFKILDYELTAPVNYTIKKFTLNFTPVYVVPVHPAMVNITTQVASLPPKTRTVNEKISNSFFFQAGVTYKIGRGHNSSSPFLPL